MLVLFIIAAVYIGSIFIVNAFHKIAYAENGIWEYVSSMYFWEDITLKYIPVLNSISAFLYLLLYPIRDSDKTLLEILIQKL